MRWVAGKGEVDRRVGDSMAGARFHDGRRTVGMASLGIYKTKQTNAAPASLKLKQQALNHASEELTTGSQ